METRRLTRGAPIFATPTLQETLDAIVPLGDAESTDLARMQELARRPDPYLRSTPLHVTASGVVVHPPTRRLLMRWHTARQAWMHVGGHVDPGETSPTVAAMREAQEETGLADLAFWPDATQPRVIHLVVVPVGASASKGEPAHEHADLRYAFSTDRPDALVAEDEESALRWVSLEEALALTDEENLQESFRRVGARLRATSG